MKEGQGDILVIKFLLTMFEALDSILSTTKKRGEGGRRRERERETHHMNK